MNNIIMLSGPDKRNYFTENIVGIIKRCVDNPINMVVIPADPNNYDKNDIQFNGNDSVIGVLKTFKKIFPNLEISLLDNRVNSKVGVEKLKMADIIYLLGGNPFIQLNYLLENKYNDILRNTNALIIGVSAGSMNLAVDAYYSKDDDYPESKLYQGLGIVDITIDPHFDINNKEQVNEIKTFSNKRKIIGLPNDSAICIINNNIDYIGDVYIFENGDYIISESN